MTPQFPRIFAWHVLRNLRRHRLLALLNVLSVALGIAVYLAIQIANHSANRSFAAGIDLVAGKAHLEVRGNVEEMLWPTLAEQVGVRAVTGLVEGVVTLSDFPGEHLRVLGVDLFSGEPFRTFEIGTGGERPALESWMGGPGGVAVTEEFAVRCGWKIGDAIRVQVNSQTRMLRVVSLIPSGDSPGGAQPRLAVMDIGWAQELFGRQGKVSSLQLLLDDPREAAKVAARLQTLLPADLAVEPPRQRSFQIQNMLSAFQLNLSALSMVSLLVGVFLIYNTISASVARRRREIGMLRAIGATRLEVRSLFLGEACLLGALGIAVGTIGGVALARVLTGAVAQTISSLYVLLSIDRNWFSPVQFLTAAFFGFGAVLAGAWLPASEAARVDPVAALSLGGHAEQAVARAPRWGRAGAAFLLVGGLAAWVALRLGPPMWSFGAAFCVLAGFALFAPATTKLFGDAASRGVTLGVLWRLASDNLRRSIHRNAVTVAALAAAIAMMVGLTVMIHSFRRSVDAWVNRGIVADLFITPASNETVGLGAFVPPAAVAWLRARPEVSGVDTFRELGVTVMTGSGPGRPALLAVVDGVYRHNLTFLGGEDARKMDRVFRGREVAVTEPFARKFAVREGDRITLATPRGPVEFTIAGVYSDYTRDQGVVLMARSAFDESWKDADVNSLAVYLHQGRTWEPVAEAFRAQFGREGEYSMYSNRVLRERILTIFDQTFAVTYILRTVAILVAFAGIFLSITTLVAEREREIGALRAIGASRGQVQSALMIESAMLGLVATMLGVAAGLVLAVTLTWVVNPAFFGWTIALEIPWTTLLATPLWILPAAVLAAWYPAARASRTPIATAVREE
jgi:putative ABC transport system permease protein